MFFFLIDYHLHTINWATTCWTHFSFCSIYFSFCLIHPLIDVIRFFSVGNPIAYAQYNFMIFMRSKNIGIPIRNMTKRVSQLKPACLTKHMIFFIAGAILNCFFFFRATIVELFWQYVTSVVDSDMIILVRSNEYQGFAELFYFWG